MLLEKLGARTMFVNRWGHYWLLVDLGSGWYHFDPINHGPRSKYEIFMLTMEEMQSMYPSYWKKNDWAFPATPETPFVRDW